jgi:hypothetical protein
MYKEVGVQINVSLTSALVGELSASRPGRFIPEKTAPGTCWRERWVVPRAGRYGEVKILDPTGIRTPEIFLWVTVTYHLTQFNNSKFVYKLNQFIQ